MKYAVIYEYFCDGPFTGGMTFHADYHDTLASACFAYGDAIMDEHKYNVKFCKIIEDLNEVDE